MGGRSSEATRLLVLVEGETEETFVKELLGPHLLSRGFTSVSARIFGNARNRDRRGGIRPWGSAKQDIVTHLKADAGWLVTTMVDYYGLPAAGDRGWPGRADASKRQFEDKAAVVQNGMAAEVYGEMGWTFQTPSRFVPFVVMHEFEALLFSNCDQLASSIGRPTLAPKLQTIRDAFSTPEEINDSTDTAPSKRIQKLVAGYQKPLFGTLAALGIGLAAIRAECPHFDEWLQTLEGRLAGRR